MDNLKKDAISNFDSNSEDNNKLLEQRNKLKLYSGIEMEDNAILHLREKFPKEMNDLDTHENSIPSLLEEYDNFSMSNLNKSQLEHQKTMEKYATENESTVEGSTRYYKLEDTYFEWNELHRLEHIERDNKIENVAYNLLHNATSYKVDIRKPYGEVRYIVECYDSKSGQMTIMCYRYDKTHIRIITAWRF